MFHVDALNPKMATGRWYDPSGLGSVTAGSPTAHTMWLTPLWTNIAGTINGLAWEVTTQGSSVSGTDHLRIGLYNDDGTGMPTGAALWDSGQQNLEVAVGVKTLVVSWTGILPKLYWLATVRQTTGTIGTAAALRLAAASDIRTMFFGDASATPTFGSSLPCSYQMTGVTGALPTISGITVNTSVGTPKMKYKMG